MSDWVNECMLGCLCIVMSVFIPFDSGLFALFLHSLYRIRAHTRMHKPQHTHSHTQAHAQWCYSFYSGVEVFPQYSIGSCTYVYFVMTLASYDWIFVFFSCAIYTRVAHSHTIKYSWNVCSFLFPSSTFCISPFFVRTACNYGLKPVTIHNFFLFDFDEFLFLHALKQSTTGTNEWGKKQPTCWTTINHTTYACTHNELHNFDDSHNFWFCDEWKAKP